MKQDSKDNSVFYINMALAVSVVLLLIFMVRPLLVSRDRGMAPGLKEDNAAAVSGGPSLSVYDIDKVKRSIPGAAGDNAEYADLEEMYKNSDRTNAGGNMVEAWRRVSLKDKTRLSEGFDKEIALSQEALKTNPNDKHAKNILFISETLKKMSADGFNYKLKKKK